MKRKKLWIALAFGMLSISTLQAQNWWKNRIKGQGDVQKQELEVPRFDGFTLAINADVKLRQGADYEMIVEAQANIIDNIELKMKDGHLRITYDRPVWRSKGITIYLTAPDVDRVAVSGSGDIKGEGSFTNLEDLALSVSGSGDIELGFSAREVSTSISGSGSLRLSGSGDRLSTKISGSGNVRAADLMVAEAQVSVSGSGSVYVHATENLEARVSGSGDIKYKGNPRIRAKTSGSGDVESIQ
ncbi:MAG TPA: head GIN domain-containing protein [Saprospiraceae bacterium]|nr:head GIN domain-containing protein [Saprospiraceae bacterium]